MRKVDENEGGGGVAKEERTQYHNFCRKYVVSHYRKTS